jgi:effector-binding domain-containing protein
MTAQPRIEDRPEQHYVGVRALVTMQTIASIADRLPEVFGWLGARGIEPAGAPFFRYHLIDMERKLDVEVGVPVAAAPTGDGDILTGVLPAGRYATVTHVGHPDDLVRVTGELLGWAAGHGLRWDMAETDRGQRWGCRLEVYKTDPDVEPDMARWETELAFRLADDAG